MVATAKTISKTKYAELIDEYDGKLPDYLVELFDEQELKKIAAAKSTKSDITKHKYKIDKFDYDKFWTENKTEIVKKKRTVPSEYDYKYKEPEQAEERLEEDIDPKFVVAACENRLDAFAKYYFPHYLSKPSSKFHRFLYTVLSKETGTEMKRAIAGPRFNSKSTIISTIYPIWCAAYEKKHFIILLSDTAGAAEGFLGDIKIELEANAALRRDFPQICGKGRIWRSDEIITQNNIKIRALGSGNQIRGKRFGKYRPDLVVCHEKGTKILHNGKWIKIENHPTAREKVDDGLEVRLYGLNKPEVVTYDHKYWCRHSFREKPHKIFITSGKWVEAHSLDIHTYIGCPIGYKTDQPVPGGLYFSPFSPNEFKEGGFIWRKVKSVRAAGRRTFIPIHTETSTYLTEFGLSHNCDDIETSEAVRSITQRNFLRYDWLNKDVLFSGGDQAKTDFLFVGTILSKYSLLNTLLDPNEYPDWKGTVFKAVEKFSDSPLWDEWKKIFKNHFDPDRIENARKFYEEHEEEMLKGVEVLWPEGDPYYKLMIAQLRDPRGFRSEKQNDAVDLSSVLIPETMLHWEDFSRSTQVQEALRRSMRYGALDPSLGKNKVSDYSAIVTLARDKVSGLVFVVDMDLKRRDVDTQIEDMLKAHYQHNYTKFGIETNAFQIVVADNLRKLSRELSVYIPIKEVKHYRDKVLRIEGLIPFISDGTLVFDINKYNTNQSYRLGVEQITTFTGIGDEQDDAPDALETAFSLAKKKGFKLLYKENR